MNRIFVLCCVFMLFSSCASIKRVPSSNEAATNEMRNILKPFTSDGCSSFPNGIPFNDENLWLDCCIKHDVHYWRGGTFKERKKADLGLQECITEKAGNALGEAMYLGVRAGGDTNLPFSWRWGYGWSIDRGYAELNSDEQAQADKLIKQIPKNLLDMPIVSNSIVPQRSSLTGDYCLDAAVVLIESKLGHAFRIINQSSQTQEKPSGYWKTLNIETDNCPSPFNFTFLLLRKNACKVQIDELTARDRIRLLKIESPKDCRD